MTLTLTPKFLHRVIVKLLFSLKIFTVASCMKIFTKVTFANFVFVFFRSHFGSRDLSDDLLTRVWDRRKHRCLQVYAVLHPIPLIARALRGLCGV